MNNTDLKEFAGEYIQRLKGFLDKLDRADLAAFALAMNEARCSGRTIFVAGNGGSAATATHMANDFGTDIIRHAPGAVPFRMLALTDNTAVMLAVSNDMGYENIFLNQLMVHFRPGDVFIAISASGNSPNVVKAAEWVKAGGGKVLALTGFDGGGLKAMADVSLHVATEKGEYGFVEDVHMVVDHLLSTWFKKVLNRKV